MDDEIATTVQARITVASQTAALLGDSGEVCQGSSCPVRAKRQAPLRRRRGAPNATRCFNSHVLAL